MEINQFEQFRAIAECGTMSDAAKKLYLSQPTISHNLKKLESELGCKLFTRASNRLHLTPYGEVVLERVRAISDDYHAMLEAIEKMKRREEAMLHIGCFSPVLAMLLMPHVASGLPESTFEVVNCPTAELVDGLDTGRFDVLIATDICRKKSFRWRKLYDERAYVSAPRGTFSGVQEVKAADLAKAQFAIESGLDGYSDWFSHILREAGVAQETIERVPYREHLLAKDSLESCNLITSFIMGFAHVSEVRDIVPIDEPFARRNVGFLYRADAPDKTTSFVSHVLRNAERFLSGNAFMSFFLSSGELANLHVSSV